MSAEVPRQIEMFTGELVDTRSERQKQTDKEHERPQQAALFSSRDIAQFGVKAKPLIAVSPQTKVVLISQDPRTPEERERDLRRAAEGNTSPLFQDDAMPSHGMAGGAAEPQPMSGPSNL